MTAPRQTCWTLVEEAAGGSPEHQERFARSYLPAVRSYLRARWRGSELIQETDDAVQEVFVEFFRGALSRVERDEVASFRGFLYGVVRNVARRFEERRARRLAHHPEGCVPPELLPSDEESLSRVFDREWALGVLARARTRQVEAAAAKGETARRRIDLLRLRLEEGLPIRKIARIWACEPAWLHHEYATAREEFRTALLETVASEHAGSRADVERECARLVSYFS